MKIILSSNTEWYLYNFRRALGQFLMQRGWEVVMVSPPGPYAEKLRGMGFRWLQWDLGRKTLTPWTELSALRQLTRIYRREHPHIVHHHTIKPALYGSLAARAARVPGIVSSITGRGYLFLGNHPGVRALRWAVRWLYRYAFAAENCVAIFENPNDRDYFIQKRMIPAARAVLIPGVGVDAEKFAPTPQPDGVPIVIHASRMLWDKGVGVLVDAARLLHQRGVRVRVALVGRPDPGNPASIPAETLRAWHEEGVIEYWEFRDDMPAVYAQAAIVTLPSMYAEGIPTVLLEAAACARPIVTTTMPGCRDFITEGYNGLLVPPNDPAALADALEKLIRSPELRARMGAAGRQRVLEKYTNNLVNTATLAVYRQLVEIE